MVRTKHIVYVSDAKVQRLRRVIALARHDTDLAQWQQQQTIEPKGQPKVEAQSQPEIRAQNTLCWSYHQTPV